MGESLPEPSSWSDERGGSVQTSEADPHGLVPWALSVMEGVEDVVFIGVTGAQGSGKSTLCRRLEGLLAERGLHVVVISIDDLYRTRDERRDLARAVHPLCALRGLPGTHDVALGRRLFSALASAGAESTTPVVRFDKAVDDRAADVDLIVGRPDVVLFEGWCVGARPGPDWEGPINEREARDDPNGEFVRWSEGQLVAYQDLFQRMDALLFIEVADFEAVIAGRQRQEEKLARSRAGVGVMTPDEVRDYVLLFERKTRELLADLPLRADKVVPAWTPS